MSTTFDVYPGEEAIPSFAQLLERSTWELHRFLESVQIPGRPLIQVALKRCRDDSDLPLSVSQPFQWTDEAYVWFTVGQVVGGTDAYFEDRAEVINDQWQDALDDDRIQHHAPHIRHCLSLKRRWTFRRSISQPALINLAYGLIAGSLAVLTNGFLDSGDSAWDWQRLPALPEEFFTWYFRPELAIHRDKQEWSQRCIGFLSQELKG